MLLEKEMAALRQQVTEPTAQETPAERGARLLRQAKANQASVNVASAKAMDQMGIRGEPIAPEKLRQMMQDCGVRPEDNEFSKAIVAMREE